MASGRNLPCLRCTAAGTIGGLFTDFLASGRCRYDILAPGMRKRRNLSSPSFPTALTLTHRSLFACYTTAYGFNCNYILAPIVTKRGSLFLCNQHLVAHRAMTAFSKARLCTGRGNSGISYDCVASGRNLPCLRCTAAGTGRRLLTDSLAAGFSRHDIFAPVMAQFRDHFLLCEHFAALRAMAAFSQSRLRASRGNGFIRNHRVPGRRELPRLSCAATRTCRCFFTVSRTAGFSRYSVFTPVVSKRIDHHIKLFAADGANIVFKALFGTCSRNNLDRLISGHMICIRIAFTKYFSTINTICQH